MRVFTLHKCVAFYQHPGVATTSKTHTQLCVEKTARQYKRHVFFKELFTLVLILGPGPWERFLNFSQLTRDPCLCRFVTVSVLFDTSKFIECARDKPASWEKKSSDYSDKNI